MNFKLFLVSVLVGTLVSEGNAYAVNELGVGQVFQNSSTGDYSNVDRNDLGAPVVKISEYGSYLTSNLDCMVGDISEEVSANENRSTFDSAAKVTVTEVRVNVTFVHHTPFLKKVSLVNEVFQPGVSTACMGVAYLKSITIAPYYYFTLSMPMKTPSDSPLSRDEWNALLRAKVEADPFFQSVRLRDFQSSDYVESVKAKAGQLATEVGLTPDGWITQNSLFGPSEMSSAVSSCIAGFHPSNQGREKCLELADMAGSLDAFYPESEAGLYNEQNGTLLTRSRVIHAEMSAVTTPPPVTE